MGTVGQKGVDGVDLVADYSINMILNAITKIECLKGYQQYVKPTGRVVVSAALVTAMYYAYQAYVDAQDSDLNDDQQVFYE